MPSHNVPSPTDITSGRTARVACDLEEDHALIACVTPGVFGSALSYSQKRFGIQRNEVEMAVRMRDWKMTVGVRETDETAMSMW